jgi:hypothetical protein
MAVVELQFRERAFLDLVGSEALRPPLASRVLDEVRHRHGPEQEARLRLTGAEWGTPFLRAGDPEPGTVLVKVMLAVDLTGPPVRWTNGSSAGSPEVTRRLTAELWIDVSVTRAGPAYRLTELRMVAPVANLAAGWVPLLVTNERRAYHHGAIMVADGIVAIRMASAADDDVWPTVEDRLDAHDWGRFVPGELLAELVVGSLDDGLDAATGWPDAEVRVEERSGGQRAWLGTVADGNGSDNGEGSGPAVRYAARMVALGALPFAFDLPFTLLAEARFALVWRSSKAAPPVLAVTAVVRAEAPDPDALAAFAPIELLRDELRAGFDGRLDTTPAGAVAFDHHHDGALRIETRRALSVPGSRAWAGLVESAHLDARGLAVRGVLALRQLGELDLRDRKGIEWASLRPVRDRPSDRPDGTVAVP